MGAFRLFSRCSTDDSCSVERVLSKENAVQAEKDKANTRLPNPNPANFRILKIRAIGKYVIVKVNYPDCTNFEGNKILVFHGKSKKEVASLKSLDPHFCKSKKHLSPVARFRPTNRGWHEAVAFCALMDVFGQKTP